MEYLSGGYPELPSRSIYDDDDSDDDTVIQPVNIEPSPWRFSPRIRDLVLQTEDKKLPCDTLLVNFGYETGVALDRIFALHSAKPISTVISHTSKLSVNQASTPYSSTCFCYDVSTGSDITVFMNCKSSVTPESAFDFAESLFRHIAPSTRVIVSHTSTHLKYVPKPEEEKMGVTFPVLRMVNTSHTPEHERVLDADAQKYVSLDAPNVVEGPPAAIMNHCEVNGINASLFVAFHESANMGPDEYLETAMLLVPVLEQFGLVADRYSLHGEQSSITRERHNVYI
eukprot:CFRG0199T1